MDSIPPAIREVQLIFTRHDRRYIFFSVTDRREDFLYYSHICRPLRSLMFGRGFIERLPQLVKQKDLCVECGLGLLMTGSYTLDGDNSIFWHCSVREADRILIDLRERLGDKGTWIELF